MKNCLKGQRRMFRTTVLNETISKTLVFLREKKKRKTLKMMKAA